MQRLCKSNAMKLVSIAETLPILCKGTSKEREYKIYISDL